MYLFQPCSGPLRCLLETLARACFTGKAGVHFKILRKESWKIDFKYPSLGSHAKRVGAGRGRTQCQVIYSPIQRALDFMYLQSNISWDKYPN